VKLQSTENKIRCLKESIIPTAAHEPVNEAAKTKHIKAHNLGN
jgi:hypothetical protein